MRFSVGATEDSFLEIRDSGNVGIGTTSPSAKLHVAGTSFFFDQAIFDDKVGIGTTSPGNKLHVNGGEIQVVNGTSGKLLLQNSNNYLYGDQNGVGILNANNNLRLYTAGSEKIRIDSAGNVGIGTSSPIRKLHLYDANAAAIKIQAGDANQARLDLVNTDGSFGIITNSGTFRIYDDTDNTERLKIDTNGKVGIGTSSPVVKLHVDGIGYFEGGTSPDFGSGSVSDAGVIINENDFIYTKDGTALRKLIGKFSSDIIQIGESGTSLVDEIRFKPGNNGFTSFYDDSTETARFTDGKLGIGSTSPTSKLTVAVGDIETSGVGYGIILKSPDGTRYRVTVANGGTLSVSAV